MRHDSVSFKAIILCDEKSIVTNSNFFVVFNRNVYFDSHKINQTIVKTLPSSELVINPEGSIYHLQLFPDQLADNVIVVGDQARVPAISNFFDSVECRIQNREFVTHTGSYRGKRISVISTGIGTDNLDIVMNEMDALVNIDLKTRTIKPDLKSLNVVRIGTSGTIIKEIPVGSFVASSHGLGFDGLLHFYQFHENEREQVLLNAILKQLQLPDSINRPYIVEANPTLLEKVSPGCVIGITATACGFYGPQGRTLRLTPAIPDLNERMMGFSSGDLRISNFEMETSALYGLSRLMGHKAATVCAIIANRATLDYAENHKAMIDKLIVNVLDQLSS